MIRLAGLLLALCLTAAPALADCVEPARGDGTVAAPLGRVDLTRDERALVEERFAPDFAEAARLGLAADALFGFARCELNGAAPPELVVVGRSPAHCSRPAGRPAVCGLWVLAPTAEGWVQVLESAGTPRLAASATNGWRDMVLERGRAPAVFKFGGAVYQEDLGTAAPTPAALEDFGGYGPGPDGIDWYAFDDRMPPQVEAAFLWFYDAEIRGDALRVGALPDAFRVGVAELDRAPPEEAVIQGLTSAFCGPEGCVHWILGGLGQDPPRILGRLTGFELQAAASGGPGGRDLVARGPEGLKVWRNDGPGWILPGEAGR